MNDPNKRIDVNISSLLSLKAELLRKQEEVSKAKVKQTTDVFVPKKSTKSDTKEKIIETPEGKTIEYEDSALLDKSRKVLEAKSRFYDKMQSSGGKLNSDDNCLVLFNQKQQDIRPYKASSSESEVSDDDDETGKYRSDRPDDDWVEYTDCLGRTRQCLKKDLPFFKKKDNQLAENIQPRMELNQNAPMWMIDTKPSVIVESSEIPDDVSEMTSLMSKHDQMKLNWEKKEEENVYKENVHYQDVLFDEARTHGVGYYGFSTDEEERAKQKRELEEMRMKTLDSQKERESQRTNREKIIAGRVKAAKNRQRARLGLPPVEDEPVLEPKLFDSKEEEKRKKREEKEKRRKEKEEKQKDDERKRHIRPWDRNKDGVPPTQDTSDSEENNEWNYKPEREPMSQDQWNEMKRDERNKEFAPMPEPPKPPLRTFRGHNDHVPYTEDVGRDSLFFTTKKQPAMHKEFKKRNYAAATVTETNSNELYDPFEDNELSSSDRIAQGVEIPPPPTFEYYGPTSSKRQKTTGPTPSLEQSIAAGLKFLRNQSDKGILPTKSSWTANADY